MLETDDGDVGSECVDWRVSTEVDWGPLVIVLVFAALLLVGTLWYIGIRDLFSKGYRALAWLAIVAIMFPLGFLVSVSGLFLLPKPGSTAYHTADGWTRHAATRKFPNDYRSYLESKDMPSRT